MATDYGAQYAKRLYDHYVADMRRVASQSESGGERPMSYEEFAALPLQTQLAQAQQYSTQSPTGNVQLDPEDPLVQQFVSQYGNRAFDPVELNNQALSGYEMGYGDPRYMDAEAGAFMQDPGRVLRLPDGRYIMESGNRRGDVIASEQERDSNSGIGDGTNWALAAAAALGGGYALGESGLLGGSNAFSGATAGGEISGGASGLVDIPGNLSWTDIAAANPELAAAPTIAGGGGLLGSIGSAITKNPLLAASLGMQAGGLLGGGGNKPAGSSWSAGSNAGGGLNIQDANYVPNQHTARQLQELYGGNNMGTPSSGQMGGQAAPWQNNLYGGGQQGMPMTGGQQSYPSMAPKPMNMMGGGLLQGMGGQNFGTKPMMMNGAGDFGPLPPPSSPPGDFGPLPPPASPGQPPNMLGPQMQSFIQNMRNNRPQVADQYVDPSVRNSAIGDGYSGRRNGFLWGGGQRLMPITGSDMQDQATLRQFGIRPPTFGSQYGF